MYTYEIVVHKLVGCTKIQRRVLRIAFRHLIKTLLLYENLRVARMSEILIVVMCHT